MRRAIVSCPSGVTRPTEDADIVEAMRASDKVLWLDVEKPGPDDFRLFLDGFGFHPLSVEDVRETHTSAKLDEYDHDEVVFQLEPRWRDRSLMRSELAREGEPKRAFQRVFERAVQRWTSEPQGGGYPEPFTSFRARCEDALRALTSDLGHSKTVLVFTSGGPIAIMMGSLLGLSGADSLRLQWRLVNAGVSKIVVGRTGPTVGSLNEHGHLEIEGKRLITYR